MKNNSFYSEDELKNIGFNKLGCNVLISKKASIYSPSKIEIGNNVRIDDFCILSGKIKIHNNVHIASGVYLFAGNVGIELHDFVGISSHCSIYAVSDDYSGNYLTNPTIDDKYKNLIEEKVVLKKHSIIGTSSVVLPGSIIEEGTAIGSMTLIKSRTEKWSIYVGVPGKKIKNRSKKLVNLEKEYINE